MVLHGCDRDSSVLHYEKRKTFFNLRTEFKADELKDDKTCMSVILLF